MKEKTTKKVLALLLLVLGITGVAINFNGSRYSKFDKRYYQDRTKAEYIRPGLHSAVEAIDVGDDGSVSVTFTLTDDQDQPLDRNGEETPGPVSVSFILGTIPQDSNHYQSITLRDQTSPITGDTATQPSTDSGGVWEELEIGRYRYTFATLLPEDYDPEATHSVGIYMRRDLTEFDLGRPVVNMVEHFLPGGGDVVNIRDIVSTNTCNNCHDPLAIHGGQRQKVELCIMCHYEGVLDPDTGNSVGMANMVHKIHQGANLPSVQAGEPYQIIGFRQSVHDYSDVHYPQETNNCKSCHVEDATTEHDLWLTNPTRDSCGSCHDNVNFATGENHVNLPQISDNLCANCHIPKGELEFDASIMGAHVIARESEQLEGINIEITDVTDAAPGSNPTVHYTLKSNDGSNIDPASLAFFNFVLAGPNSDFNFNVSERAVEGSVAMGDGYTYTFQTTLPENDMASYTVGAEAFRTATLNAGTVNETTIRETADNPIYSFAVGGQEMAVWRRNVVSDAKCDSCHREVALHGTIRHNVDYCVTCHQPGADDSPFREEGEPARSIDFKFMIHRIHRGSDLTRDYSIVGFGGSLHNYNHTEYPGDLRNCQSCHVGDSYALPGPGEEPTIEPYEFFSPIQPDSSACLGCHDTQDAAAHAYVNTSPFGESCGSCHGPDAEFSVERVHARLP